MNAPTQKIARYELVREIGRGESGTVYEARDGVDGRTVALKVFRRDPGVADDSATTAEFLRLAHHLMMLDHPNIVPVLNCGSADGHNYVAMQLVTARSLRRWLDVVPRMSFEWVLSIALQVADALTCAHNAGICHHALKPANILLDENGHVSVTDFAIPLLAVHSGNSTGVPSVPQYLAPEQVRAEVADARADLFALGAITFELLTGRAPFGSCADMSVIRVLENIVQQIPQPASSFDPEVPPALDRVVLKSLS
ncbi:MAG: serine/threonine protein kinase, partial [Rhodocyclaceae bacterium]|nr:serine/threonine protein kinase [Rhodocyclaceae bacterium]